MCISDVSMYSDYKPILGKEKKVLREREKKKKTDKEKETDSGKLGSPFVINITHR